MTDVQRKEWIDGIESALKKYGGEGGGIINKAKLFGSKILGQGMDIPDDIEEKAKTALRYLKDPSSTDAQIDNALAPIKELIGHLQK